MKTKTTFLKLFAFIGLMATQMLWAQIYPTPSHQQVDWYLYNTAWNSASETDRIGPNYMTRYWSFLKNLPLKDFHMIGSHHATYNGGPGSCHPQDDSFIDQIDGGSRYGDIRLNAEYDDGTIKFRADHGDLCDSENQDFFEEMGPEYDNIGPSLGTYDIVILHIKQFYDSDPPGAWSLFISKAENLWGDDIIKPSELSGAGLSLNTATLSQLSQYGKIIIIQPSRTGFNNFTIPETTYGTIDNGNPVFGYSGAGSTSYDTTHSELIEDLQYIPTNSSLKDMIFVFDFFTKLDIDLSYQGNRWSYMLIEDMAEEVLPLRPHIISLDGVEHSTNNSRKVAIKCLRQNLLNTVPPTLTGPNGLSEQYRTLDLKIPQLSIDTKYSIWEYCPAISNEWRKIETLSFPRSASSKTDKFQSTNYDEAYYYIVNETSGLRSEIWELPEHTEAHWKFNEISGTSVADATGYGNTGTINGDPVWVAGKAGNGLQLDGTGDYVSIDQIDLTGDFTITAWVKLDGTIDNQDELLGQVSPGDYIDFKDGKPRIRLDDGISFQSSKAITNGWNHVAFIRHGTDPGNLRVLVNRDLGGYSTDSITSTFSFDRLGSAYGTNTSGIIDEIRVYKRALTTAQLFQLPGLTEAHWKLDETSGTSAADATGHYFTGTINGNPTWVAGKIGNGLKLDGTGDWVSYSKMDLPDDFTIAGWVKLSGTINNQDVLVGSGALSNNINFGGGYPRLYNGSIDVVTSSVAIKADTWTHIAVTREGTGTDNVTMYVNGVQTGQGSWNGAFYVSQLGKAYPGDANTEGIIDDIRISNTAKDVSEIRSWLVTDPEAHWKLDETSGTSVADASGHGHTGTINGNPTWVASRDGNGLKLDGTGDYVSMDQIDLPDDFTIAAWVKLDGTINNADELLGQVSPGDYIDFKDGKPRIRLDDGISLQSSIAITNSWAHVAFVREGTATGNLKVYVNGTLAGTSTGSITSTFSFDRLGSAYGTNTSGTLDDIRIYKVAKTVQEIRSWPGLSELAHWKFNETSGTFASDASGNGHTGTINGNPTWVAGRTGNGLKLDGNGDWVNVTDFDLPDDFTIAAWVKLSGTINGYDAMLGKDGAGNDINFTNAKPRLYNGSSDVVTSSVAITADIWAHVAVTRKGTGTNNVTMYVNGTQTGQGSWNGTFTVGALGKGNNGTNTEGIIDDLRIFNTAKSQEEIRSLPGVIDLQAHWKFDETSGTSAADASGHGYTGTIHGNPTWVASRDGNGLKLDGTGDYVSIDQIDLVGDFTIAAWVKLDGTINNEDELLGQVSPGDYIDFKDGKPRISLDELQGIRLQSSIAITNSWAHVAFVREGTATGNLKVYVNGTLAGTSTGSITSMFSFDRLGSAYGTSTNGTLDDIRIYNTAKTIDEINELPGLSKLEAYWKLDSGNSAADASGNGHTGTIIGNRIWVAGKTGNGLKLDGAGDYVSIDQIDLPDDFTIAAWVKLDGTIDNTDELLGQVSPGDYIDFKDGKPRIGLDTNISLQSSIAITNSWAHVAFVREGTATGNLKVYVDGTLAGTSTGSITSTFSFDRLGSAYRTNTEGTLDDIRIYNKALSSIEINDLPGFGGGSSKTANAKLGSSVEVEDTLGEVLLYPNPVSKGVFTIVLPSGQPGSANLSLFDIRGVKVKSANVPLQQGNNTFNVETSGMANGLYLVSITTNGKKTTKRILINNQ